MQKKCFLLFFLFFQKYLLILHFQIAADFVESEAKQIFYKSTFDFIRSYRKICRFEDSE